MTIAKEIFGSASNRRRLGLALALFFFHKGTGTDAINYFAPEIFKSIGVVGNSSTLLTTGIYGIVKLAATLIYVLFIIDRVGRRVPLLVGATIQATAMLVLGLFVGIADPVNNPNGKGVHGGGIFAIIAIYMYAVGWAMGHSIACYVVAAEIFRGPHERQQPDPQSAAPFPAPAALGGPALRPRRVEAPGRHRRVQRCGTSVLPPTRPHPAPHPLRLATLLG